MYMEIKQLLFTESLDYSIFAICSISIFNILYTTRGDEISYFNQLLYWGMIFYYTFLKGNIYSGVIYIRNLFCKCKIINQESNSTIINYVNSYIERIVCANELDIQNYILYDFGCGDCVTLSKLTFENKIGVDIDRESIKFAEDYIKHNDIENIELVCNDILNIEFHNKFIIYMYEPLWLCNSNETYIRLFQKIKEEEKHGYIIYVTGLLTKHLDDFLFEHYKITILDKKTFGSVVLNRNIYLLRI